LVTLKRYLIELNKIMRLILRSRH